MKKIFSFNENKMKIIYKLSCDVLFLLLIVFTVMLLAEGVLPGLISAHVSFVKITFVLFIVTALIAFMGKKYNFIFSPKSLRHSKFFPPFVVFAFLLLGNAQLRFSLWQNLVITLSVLLFFFLFYSLLFPKD